MSLPVEEYDITIQKGTKFYIEFQQTQDNGVPIPLTRKTVSCKIIESIESPVVLHNLTEANGGLVKVDIEKGIVGMLVKSNESNVTANYGIYQILIDDDDYPGEEIECMVKGNVTYTTGAPQ